MIAALTRIRLFPAAFACILLCIQVYADEDAPLSLLSVNSYITNWIVAGPLPNPHTRTEPGEPLRREGFFRDFFASEGGETQATPRVGASIPFRAGIRFTSVVSRTPDVDLNKIYSMVDNAVAYAFTRLDVPAATTLFLHVGSDDGIRIWLDGELIIDSYKERGWQPDEDWVQVTLTEGEHALLVKCDDLYGAWCFSLRFTDRATHYALRAKRLSPKLFYTLTPATGTFDTISIAPFTKPVITDMPIRIIGTLISDDNSFTQSFDCVQNESILLAPQLAELNICHFTAEARGMPGITPKCDVTLYLRGIDGILAKRKAAVENVLSFTNTPGVEQHRGILKWYLQQAHHLTSHVDNVTYDSRIHSVISQCDAIIQTLLTNGNYLAHLRGSFTCAYISRVDNNPHPFNLTVPNNYNPDIPTPLVIFLHDAGQSFSRNFRDIPELSSYISLRIFGRGGNGGYVGLSAFDITEARKYVQRYYSIDKSRIYCVGSSMGGYGTLMNAAENPHVYAAIAALNTYSADTSLQNLRNIPAMLIHGDEDLIVPVHYSRAALLSLRSSGCPVVYKELPGVGYRLHNAAALIHPIQWLLNHRGNSAPQDVTLDATLPSITKAYWVQLHSRISPRKPAHIDARFFSPNELVLSLYNVYHASFGLPDSYVDSSSLLSVLANGQQFEIPGPLPPRIHLLFTNNQYKILRTSIAESHRYAPGSWQSMYDGSPLIIVYGTQGSENRNDAIKKCAQKLAQWSYIARDSGLASIPLYPDTDVTDEMLAAHNVILLGGVKENDITDNIANDLHTPLTARTITINETKKDITQSGLWLSQNSPFNPTNRVWIWTATRPEFYSTAFAWQNIWKFPAADPPDVLIYNCDSNCFTFTGHFNAQWKMAVHNSPSLNSILTNDTAFKKCIGKTLVTAADADIAWIGSEMTTTFSYVKSLPAEEAAPVLFPRTTVMSCTVDTETLRSLHSSHPASLYIPDTLSSAVSTYTNCSYSIAFLPRALRLLNDASRSKLSQAKYTPAQLSSIFITHINRYPLCLHIDDTKPSSPTE